jgi:hypothetical protein
MHLGERYKKQALIWPTLHRSFVFLVLLIVLMVRPLGQDRAAMGRSFEDLKTYQRCP